MHHFAVYQSLVIFSKKAASFNIQFEQRQILLFLGYI